MSEFRNIEELAHELTYHRYLLNQSQARGLIRELSIPQYIALQYVSRAVQGGDAGRVYLRDVARELRLSIPQASRMVGSLRDKGLVSWSHDGDGSEGTYVVITDEGHTLMATRKSISEDYYSRVIARFGEENMVQLLDLIKQLGAIMKEEGSATRE